MCKTFMIMRYIQRLLASYAEDLQIYLRVSIDQLESGVAALTRVANRVYEWAGAAALKLNASKTKAMRRGSRDFVDKDSSRFASR